MSYSRIFVRHRNESTLPLQRKVEIHETKCKGIDGYPEMTVIIPTVDGYRDGHLPALLTQLEDQSYQNFEIIIIQGDSRQGRAINIGADIARGEYLLTLDDDTFLPDRLTFDKLVDAIRADATIGMAGGINIVPNNSPLFIRQVMRQLPRRSTPQVDKITESDLAEHPLLLMRKDLFKMVGGENELLPRGLDPYLRSEFRKAGYKVVVVPKAYYSHMPPPTLTKLIKQFFRNGKQSAFCNKYYPQWTIETPDTHVNNFAEKRPFYYRALRYIKNILKNCIKGRWIYLSVYLSYAFGFGWGYIRFKNEDQA